MNPQTRQAIEKTKAWPKSNDAQVQDEAKKQKL